MTKDNILYAVTSDCVLVKVGITKNLDRRIKELQTFCDKPLTSYDCHTYESRKWSLEAEHVLLAHLHRFQVEGEWFHKTEESLEIIDQFFDKERARALAFECVNVMEGRNRELLVQEIRRSFNLNYELPQLAPPYEEMTYQQLRAKHIFKEAQPTQMSHDKHENVLTTGTQ